MEIRGQNLPALHPISAESWFDLKARVTTETGLFGRLQDVTDVISPRPEEVDRISGIYGEIVRNEKASAAEFEALRTLAHVLIQRESLDAILLAGTDFPLCSILTTRIFRI